MCNLYSVTSNQEVIRAWAGVMTENDSTGNMQPIPEFSRIMPRRSCVIMVVFESSRWFEGECRPRPNTSMARRPIRV